MATITLPNQDRRMFSQMLLMRFVAVTVVEDHPGDVKRMLDLVGLQITYVCWISEGASAG